MESQWIGRVGSQQWKLMVRALVLLLSASSCALAHVQEVAPSQGQSGHHKFTAVSAARGFPTKGVLEVAYDTWKSEDGTPVLLTEEEYKSSSDSRNALDKLIGTASRVIKQDIKKDPKGKVIGKRVELLFTGKDKSSTQFVIAWTNGSILDRLSCKSLPLLLDFESQAYP